MHLRDKRLLLGVTGGIAAYKSAEVVRQLRRDNAQVGVVMTENAHQFITPLTFESLTSHPVITDTFALGEGREMNHIVLPEACDAFIIAPATANCLAKLAHGIADDVLTTMALVADGANRPCVLAPAMNSHMYTSSPVQANLEILQGRGWRVVGPGAGDLACGYTGPGRMAEPLEIIDAVKAALAPKDLAGVRVLVTAGPTREAFDPVRFISNRSSGKMGFALASAAARRGALVTLVTGPAQAPLPYGLDAVVQVETAAEMEAAVLERIKAAQVAVMCAAVADYAPVKKSAKKEARYDKSATTTVKLTQTPDIAARIGRMKTRPFLVGFAAETHDVLGNAGAKMERKHMDMIVANLVGAADSGFEVDTNRAAILSADGGSEELPLLTKEELADVVLSRVVERLGKKPSSRASRKRAPARTKTRTSR